MAPALHATGSSRGARATILRPRGTAMSSPETGHDTPTTGTPTADVAERARQVRARLLGQVVRDRIDTAAARYGPLYTRAEIERRVSESLPLRLGARRTAVFQPIESYSEQRIPDDVLVAYDEALASHLFSRFWVVSPAYRTEVQADPWILGEVNGTSLFAVITHWP